MRINREYLFSACYIARESVTIIWVCLAGTQKEFFIVGKKYGFRSALI